MNVGPRRAGLNRIVAFVAFVAAGLFSEHAAIAQTEQQENWCVGKDGATLDQQIDGCTAAIQSGQDSGKALAADYVLRGNAYFAKHDFDRAIADFSEVINSGEDTGKTLAAVYGIR